MRQCECAQWPGRCALGGGESGHARASILEAPSVAGPYIVLPTRCVGCYGCRRRVSSLSREVLALETLILRIELDVLTKAAMQVLYGRTTPQNRDSKHKSAPRI